MITRKMIAIFGAFLAVALEAPRDYDGISIGSRNALSSSFGEGTSETRNFQFDSISKQIYKLSKLMRKYNKYFPTTACEMGKEYVVTVNMTGFDDKELVVKAQEDVLLIQAVDQDESDKLKDYITIKMLGLRPNVDIRSGRWGYHKNVLKIAFSLTKKNVNVSTEVTIKKPAKDRSGEELDKKNYETYDEDFNGLSNEVEFVPGKYRY